MPEAEYADEEEYDGADDIIEQDENQHGRAGRLEVAARSYAPVIEYDEREEDEVRDARHVDGEEEADERCVVAVPYAICYPWAVMVHTQDAALADFAVVRAWGFVRLAVSAVARFQG